MIKSFLTTHEVSKFCNVYPTTVINWIKEGMLSAYTTPGGHRRIKKEDLLNLMKKNNMPIPEDLKKMGNGKVLIIDDDPKILQMIKTILSQEGLETSVANSGFLAGFLVSDWVPDIIVLDILMPDIDGFEVCRRLKSDEKTRDIPIVASTVLNDVETIERIKSCGMADYIFKPFKSDELVKKIKEHISA